MANLGVGNVVVVGAGINGVVSAIELKQRGHPVMLIDPGPIPHPLAASTDVSKAVRTAYGRDADYAAMAETVIPLWRKWNEEFGTRLFHEVGMMFLRRQPMQPGDFEYESLQLSMKTGGRLERVSEGFLGERFPAWSNGAYRDGILEREAGYVESGRLVLTLANRADRLGIELRAGVRFSRLDEDDNGVKGVVLDSGERLAADKVVMAVGAWTPYLLPFTRKYFRATGHPVFHLKPRNPDLFVPECFPIFGADISTTGYYGFPLNQDGIVKIANHGPGREMSPDSGDRTVTAGEEEEMRQFVAETLPDLGDASLVQSHICLYCDTRDGNFWIAPDPERAGLVIAAGDNGHAFKFAPLLGAIIADAVESRENPILKKFRWRPELGSGSGKEAARFLPG